jgi:hypothetical protein
MLRPVHLGFFILSVIRHVISGVRYLEAIAAAPYRECHHEQHDPSDDSSCRSTETRIVQREAEDRSADDLRNPVENVV